MNRIIIRTKMGMKRDILQEKEQHSHVMRMEDCRTTRQVGEWNPQGRGGEADQSARGRIGLGTARKEETSRMKHVSIESSGGKQLCRCFEKNYVFTEKFL
jgi:hypothetical protein